MDPSETVILIEATYQAKPPKDRIMRVPMRIAQIPEWESAILIDSTDNDLRDAVKKQLSKHNRRPEATIVHCARVPRVDHG